ncbi:MAG: substrate-binding domain-containing protein [Verrucomicrobia bacterium]|nr:substrate-binding domain-containing protein [Verrucomicrobiota bacterium]
MTAKTAHSPALPKRLSLVTQTMHTLCEGILAGHWQKRLPGERELCERLQVSRRTLRTALEEMQRTGWLDVTHRQSRRIKRKRAAARPAAPKGMVAVLSPSPLQAMSQKALVLVDVLREKLANAGCSMELHVIPRCFSAHPARALRQLVHARSAAVWLLVGSAEPTQKWFFRQRLPCLVLGSSCPGIALPSVDADHRAVCRHAGGLLLRKGHQRIALVLPQRNAAGDVASEEGLRESLGTGRDTQLRVLRHDGTAEHLCSLLDDALRESGPPTAYVVARPTHVLTVMMHLMRWGRRIPQDVAVISRDDDTYLQATSPSIARYAVDPARFARRISLAARQLAETGTLPAISIRLMPAYVPGETV